MKIDRILTLIQHLHAASGQDSIELQALTRNAAEKYQTIISKLILNEGKTQACRVLKESHVIAIKIATEDYSFTPLPFRKSSKEGIPDLLKPVLPLLRSPNMTGKQTGLTVTRFYEQIVLPPVPDMNPITDPGPVLDTQLLDEVSNFAGRGVDRIHATKVVLPGPDTLTSSLTRGPNGPSIITSHWDARAILDNPVMYKALCKLSVITNTKGIMQLCTRLGNRVPPKNYRISRISLLQQGGGKTRVIGIGDFGSQNVLKPLHDRIMKLLRQMETDGTYDQDSQTKRIAREARKDAHSFDLSSATDRFPLKIQEILLSKILGEEAARLGADVMARERPFHIGDKVVKGARGQPLGLLSSWAVFSLTHHMIIEFCAMKEGYQSFRQYAVLGDDVVIGNKRVATRYKQVLKSIDVSINWQKSLVSTGDVQRVEFAKRIIFKGHEISPLRGNILHAATRSIYSIMELLDVCSKRGGDLDGPSIEAPDFLSVKGKSLLSILLWAKGGADTHHLRRSCPISSNLVALQAQVLRERRDAIEEKRIQVDKLLCKSKPIEQLFEKAGVSVDGHSIGHGSGDPMDLHPVVWALNKCGEELAIALSILESAEIPTQDYPEVLPIEYLPIPLVTQYFGKRDNLRTKYHSQLVLKAYFKLFPDQSTAPPVGG